MATLADELAADLDFTDEEEEVNSDYDEEEKARKELEQQKEEEDAYEQMNVDNNETVHDLQEDSNSIKKTCKLLYSKQLQDILKVRLYSYNSKKEKRLMCVLYRKLIITRNKIEHRLM